jgi:hypothetical protein
VVGGLQATSASNAFSAKPVVGGAKVRERRLVKVDRETKKRIEDFFEGFELVEFLQLPAEEIIERFEDEVEEALDEIEELMGLRQRGDDE